MHNYFIQKIFGVMLIACFLSTGIAHAQELDVNVEINRSRIENRSLNYLNNFEQQIENYLNGHDWTNATFQPREKIKAAIQIYLTGASNNYTFTAELVVRSMRPIYNTARYTTLFLYSDDHWTFQYIPNQTFTHNELQYDAIATLLNFYAYLIIGYDYDSFEPLGGTPYFLKAQQQASIAQSVTTGGWTQTNASSNSRIQLIETLTAPNYERFRKALYTYHRLGLDQFIKNPSQARQHILESLQTIQQAKEQTTNNLLFNIFFNVKYLEITSIFKDASPQMRQKAFNILSEIDINHLDTYRQLQ